MHFIVKCFLSTHSRWPPPPLRCSHRRCQLKQLAARDPHYFILLERHTLPPPFCLRCTLAMIHTVLSEANFFFFSSTKAPLGELLDSLWQLEVFFFSTPCQNVWRDDVWSRSRLAPERYCREGFSVIPQRERGDGRRRRIRSVPGNSTVPLITSPKMQPTDHMSTAVTHTGTRTHTSHYLSKNHRRLLLLNDRAHRNPVSLCWLFIHHLLSMCENRLLSVPVNHKNIWWVTLNSRVHFSISTS